MDDFHKENLILKSINEIVDKNFFIPHYQRGFRWTDQQVKQLLDDIDNFEPREILGKPGNKTFYCLQPVVVKTMTEEKKINFKLEGEWFEVIDGQQRLTTFYIILHYINQKWSGEDKLPQFKINYETRPGCVDFLKRVKVNPDDTVDIEKSNIDFYHISRGLQTIRHWQINYQNEKGKPLNKSKFQSIFEEYAKIIWYEVSPNENGRMLFERLNLGKIPLTNAELTKALFLSENSFRDISQEERKIKQIEIARLWDEIEHKLNETDAKFWSFITNKKRECYDTKIELILDMISGKSDDQKDPFFTFLEFTKKQKSGNLSDVWDEIEQFYYTLVEWYSDRNLYHKIGYLITAKSFGEFKSIDLGKWVKDSLNKSKDQFSSQITDAIKNSVKVEISELKYGKYNSQIFNVLLLFNVETNRKSDAISEFYPFKQHKGNEWSLEHIHARNSEKFDKTKREPWRKWLDLHLPILEEFKNTLDYENLNVIQNITSDITKYNNDKLTWDRFADLYSRVNNVFTLDIECMNKESDGISNLALLSQPDNAALNNSVFEIKRREIIRLDKEGSFIPVCTRRVFMKYYSNEGVNTQLFYWSEEDRKYYFNSIQNKLKKYLPLNYIETIEDENGYPHSTVESA